MDLASARIRVRTCTRVSSTGLRTGALEPLSLSVHYFPNSDVDQASRSIRGKMSVLPTEKEAKSQTLKIGSNLLDAHFPELSPNSAGFFSSSTIAPRARRREGGKLRDDDVDDDRDTHAPYDHRAPSRIVEPAPPMRQRGQNPRRPSSLANRQPGGCPGDGAVGEDDPMGNTDWTGNPKLQGAEGYRADVWALRSRQKAAL